MTWTLTLDGWLPMSMNERERAHWSKRKKELRRIVAEFGWQQIQQRIRAARGPRRVAITVVKSKRSTRRDDPGNLHARAKSVLDALVFLRLLRDDDDANLQLAVVEQDEREAKPCVRVTLEDIDR